MDGAVHAAGTSRVTRPPDTPPVAAVYVKVIVRPVWLADTAVGEAVIVPLPSAAYTVIEGEPDVMLVSEPFAVDFSWTCQVCAPVEEVAVAPEPPPLVSPYVIEKVEPAPTVSEETVIVWPETETV